MNLTGEKIIVEISMASYYDIRYRMQFTLKMLSDSQSVERRMEIRCIKCAYLIWTEL